MDDLSRSITDDFSLFSFQLTCVEFVAYVCVCMHVCTHTHTHESCMYRTTTI